MPKKGTGVKKIADQPPHLQLKLISLWNKIANNNIFGIVASVK